MKTTRSIRMQRPAYRQQFILTAALILTVVMGQARVHADESAAYERLITKTAPALVTVKFVLKMQGAGGKRDFERDITAVMIEPQGLVLCSSVQLGTSKLMRRFGTTTPTDIKVLIGDDTEGVDAKLLASDNELDLSWLQIKEPDAKGYVHVDLTKAKQVRLGERILSLARMDKFFDRAVIVNEGLLSGRTKKPRDLLIPSSGLEATPGMPIFSADGMPVGIVVVQAPDPEDIAASRRSRNESTKALILPLSDVLKATQRAKASADDEEEEDDEEGEATTPKAADGKVSAGPAGSAKDKGNGDQPKSKSP